MFGLISTIKTTTDQRDALIAILVEGTTGMPGCLSYIVAKDTAERDTIWVTEAWQNRDSHQASLALPSVQQAIAKGRPMIAGFGGRFETQPVGGVGLARKDDEQAIRNLVAEWMAATKRGDTAAVLKLMTDDALFLIPGRPPMDKAAFAAASQPASGAQPVVEGISDIKEIHVDGATAYMWSHLTVIVTPPDGSPPLRREGHTLTIFRRTDGQWLLARDANLLVKV